MNLFGRRTTSISARQNLESFFTRNNVVVRERETMDSRSWTCCFEYQGGHFIAHIDPNDTYVSIYYRGFYEVGIEYIDVVRAQCNTFNEEVKVFKVSYTPNDERDKLVLHIGFHDDIINDKEFASRLQFCFKLQRHLVEHIETQIKEDDEVDTENKNITYARKTFLINELEINHSVISLERHHFDLTQQFTIGELLPRLLNVELPQYDELTVSTVATGVNIERDHDAIAATDLLHIIVRGDATGYKSNIATMVLRAGSRFISIVITPAGVDDTSCYVRVTITLVPQEISPSERLGERKPTDNSASVLLALDRESANKKAQEFKYMWEDAILKIKAGEKLEEEQQFLASIAVHDVGYSYYWGMRHFHQGRYYEAITHLEHCYEDMRRNISDDNNVLFRDICFHLGFSYHELGNLKMAYFFLDYLQGTNKIQHVSELVNSLANQGDVRTFGVIERILAELKETCEDKDDVEEHILRFRDFLLRRRAFTLIEINQLDEAEKMFKDLLESPYSHDYAVEELAYIQRRRGSNQPQETPQDEAK